MPVKRIHVAEVHWRAKIRKLSSPSSSAITIAHVTANGHEKLLVEATLITPVASPVNSPTTTPPPQPPRPSPPSPPSTASTISSCPKNSKRAT